MALRSILHVQEPGYQHDGMTLPGVDAVAFRDTAGALWLALVNLDPHEAREVAIDVAGLDVRSAAGEVLTGPNVNSLNTFAAPATVAPAPIAGRVSGGTVTVDLPGKSVAVLSLSR
ncbi:hypothetical protein M3P36_10755 [Altererythrobacter sp. KTW20L]|uniref:alpha-L-arabinofuranosidase C-terminal domain-containing protein n=1 Tax=Altererythrobacter sp. KTW20L TaxID=2942210 RepID=UPI0020BF6904|nr:alpha-L-arabinofuranosidase C-terminal domain-containing protein [Altererythrobacter sp. KTW20L]MCL6251518.1 hypothetical protein [Altererythrobacter sp. KTW20L]